MAYRTCADTTICEVIKGLDSSDTIITKRLLELLFASGIGPDELAVLIGPLSRATRRKLSHTAAIYFGTTKSVLTTHPELVAI
jgi:hypothetical protein